uniref:D-hexose-6-phosphate mutarotase n=1 Tax=Ningiella ruwaisensis TaxID=2364274 RepID=UPI00109F1A15|nr:D-hexose-6-phosphate mutarotase [Ningiella ruwaisensis]
MSYTLSSLEQSLISESKSVKLSSDSQGLYLNINNAKAMAKLSLFGAHLLSYKPARDNQERLFVSRLAKFDAQTPIRGGVPICWPWFGAAKESIIGSANESTNNSIKERLCSENAGASLKLPSHGFVRTQYWQLTELEEMRDKQNIVETSLTLRPTRLGLYNFPAELLCELKIKIGEKCSLILITNNYSNTDIRLSGAIHSYFRVSDIANVSIKGIEREFSDKLDDLKIKAAPIQYLISEETDRVHRSDSAQARVIIEDSGILQKADFIELEHKGQNALVVWNPWVEKSHNMADMGENEYRKMLCIESAIEPEIVLESGKQHILEQSIS